MADESHEPPPAPAVSPACRRRWRAPAAAQQPSSRRCSHPPRGETGGAWGLVAGVILIILGIVFLGQVWDGYAGQLVGPVHLHTAAFAFASAWGLSAPRRFQP